MARLRSASRKAASFLTARTASSLLPLPKLRQLPKRHARPKGRDNFMANQETQLLDEIITTSRRKMLTFGAASLAGLVMAAAAPDAKAATVSYSDSDILNFALNLEYLEANFYYLAAFGTTIDKANAASVAAGGPSAGIPITGSVGTAGTVSGGRMGPFYT